MLSITPCQRVISDRFPVASFVVNAPPQRLFEIAYATDPTLFDPQQRNRRTPGNFFSTRLGGLMRAPAGHATYFVPAEQLRRFAGSRRLFYNVASYAGTSGEDARFHVAPQHAQLMPSIQMAADFTGKTLDRSRLGAAAARAEARYGAAAGQAQALTWGADLLHAEATRPAADSGGADYDDGYGPRLGRAEQRAEPASAETGTRRHAAPNATLAAMTTAPPAEPAGYEEMLDVAAHGGQVELDMHGAAEQYPSDTSGVYGAHEWAAGRVAAVHSRPAADSGNPRVPGSERYGSAARDEPSGFEDGAAWNRAGRPGGQVTPVLGGRAQAMAESTLAHGVRTAFGGFEDAPAMARAAGAGPRLGGAPTVGARSNGVAAERAHVPVRAQAKRYGDAADGGATATQPTLAPAATPAGRDDDYGDDDSEGVEPELPLDLPDAEVLADAAPVALSIPEKFKLVMLVAENEGGRGPAAYGALNCDGEYEDASHRFHGQRHLGLSWGIVQFTQRSGALGRVLRACERRDAGQFAESFGPDSAELLRVTNAATPDARLQPVAGSLLWQGAWPERFVRAAAIPAFQAAQNEVAIEGYFDPNLPFARWLNWNTDRALAMLYDRCVHMGNPAARSWIVRAISPIRTQRQRAAVLAALGASSLQEFAESVPELGGDGRWTASCHAALLGAVRELGSAAPIPLPTLAEQLDRVVNAARGKRFADRLTRLRNSGELLDAPYQLLG